MKAFQKPLSSAEEKQCLQDFHAGSEEARDTLIERNMRLVAHVVKKYGFAERDMDDLISIGTIGLIKAVNTFDVDKGARLATYAAKCIENEILMYLRSEKKRSREVSLQEPIGTDKEGNEISLMDILENGEQEVAEVVALKQDIRKLYELFESRLKEKEKMVVRMRYGLYGTREYTQREIAEKIGISRSYVSRIEKGALKKLRDGFELRKDGI